MNSVISRSTEFSNRNRSLFSIKDAAYPMSVHVVLGWWRVTGCRFHSEKEQIIYIKNNYLDKCLIE